MRGETCTFAKRPQKLLSITALGTQATAAGLQPVSPPVPALECVCVQFWAMALLDRIQKDMVDAMKAKNEARLSAIRMIKSALQKHQIDSMKPLTDEAEIQVMNTLLKQRRESADMFRKGGREELAAKEEAEIGVIENYLPAAPGEAELTDAVSAAIAETGATSAKQMGLVMKAAQAKLAGKRVDGKALSDLVKQKLG